MNKDFNYLIANLNDASLGMLFGSHHPMNVFSKKLIQEPWIIDLQYLGYSSSCVYFAIKNADFEYINVYTSYQSIYSKLKDRVTIQLDSKREKKSTSYFRDNITVSEAVKILEKVVTSKKIQNILNQIETKIFKDHLVITLKDDWISIEQFKEILNKNIENINSNIINIIYDIKNIEHLPLEILSIICEFSKEIESV